MPGMLSNSLGRLFSQENSGKSLIVSNWLGGDLYRCNDVINFRQQKDDLPSPTPFSHIEGIVTLTGVSLVANESPEGLLLADHHVALSCSEDINVNAGISRCAASPIPADEFLHIAVNLADPTTAERFEGFFAENITCLLLVTDHLSGRFTLVPVPAVAHFS